MLVKITYSKLRFAHEINLCRNFQQLKNPSVKICLFITPQPTGLHKTIYRHPLLQ